ncbi:hypothetical protein [Duncaniella muris]|uniref:hypothetical protein n=1 Tax=Duncaniella muris TaxID=2094150 RepID=UPI003F678C47
MVAKDVGDQEGDYGKHRVTAMFACFEVGGTREDHYSGPEFITRMKKILSEDRGEFVGLVFEVGLMKNRHR